MRMNNANDWLKRGVLAIVLTVGLSSPFWSPVQPVSAQRNWCDYVAEQGIVAADSMVHYWWARGHASGCW